MKPVLIWLVIAALCLSPIVCAAFSPFLAYRSAIYIGAGFAGIVAFALILLQPLAVSGWLPGVSDKGARRLHRWIGALIVMFVAAHVLGLWITSPPDVIDALTFTSATPFSVWGVLAMWAVFASAAVAILRSRGRIRWRAWRRTHLPLAILIAVGTILHALLIEGTMEAFTKIALCGAVGLATAASILLRVRQSR